MDKIKVTLTRSTIGANARQRATVAGLGLRRVNHSRVLENTPAVRGMIKRVLHLVEVSEDETVGQA
jgi:large subunit ribosomal protein L30